MRASFVEDTLLVSVSGGGKVNFSINPLDGALVPVVGITKDGYVMAKIEDADITFPGSSVETWEAAVIGLAGQSTQDGVENFEQYIGWLNFQFSRHQVLPVVLPGYKTLYSELDHNHNQTIAGTYDRSRLSVSRPDSRYFPPRDFSCGMFESAMDSVSGFWQADRKETVIIELTGHGLIALGNGRENLTRTLTQEVELKTPEWV
jgi:hypothetical protein